MRSYLILILLLSISDVRAQDEIAPVERADNKKNWKLRDGGQIKGEVVGLKDGVAEFAGPDGKRRQVALNKLEEADSRAAMVARVGSGVVVIQVEDVFGQPMGFGSGFVINQAGWILTNYHVVAGAAEIEIKFRGIKAPVKAQLFSIDRQYDIAVLRVAPLPKDTHVLELKSRRLPPQGESVWTIGHPNGLENTVGRGEVNAVRKAGSLPPQIQGALGTPPEDSQWVQTNAVLAQGSSGGPLLNQAGQVVGINTRLLGPQFGFAIHISHARDAYAQAKQAKPLSLPVSPGENEDPNGWICRPMAPVLRSYSEGRQRLEQTARGVPQDKLAKELEAIHAKCLQQSLQVARQQPESWPGAQAMFYGLQFCDTNKNPKEFSQICDLALKHHADSNYIKPILSVVAQHPTATARRFCQKLEEQTKSASVRLSARFSLASSLLSWMNRPDSIALKSIQEKRTQLSELIDGFGKDIEDDSIPDGVIERVQATLRQQFNAVRLGSPAPEIAGTDIKSVPFKLSDYKGKVVLLDFFTNWCPHCVKMYPYERQLVKTMKNSPFALLGIHCESQQVLDKLIKDEVVTWKVWADGAEGRIARDWRVTGFPLMVLIDHNGIVRWQADGAPTEAQLTKLIDQLVKEAVGPNK